MDKEFTHNGAILMAVSAGFKENGCDVYEVQTPEGDYIGNLIVNPIIGLEESIEDWKRDN